MTFVRKPWLGCLCLTACAGSAPPATLASAPSASVTGSSSAAPLSATPAASPTPPTPVATEEAASKPASLTVEALALPGATAPVSLDFLFYEERGARVWVPAGGTGSVDVFDLAKHEFTRVDGFKTVEREAHGKKRVLGPSAGAVGDGFAYVGNRATQEICAVDLRALKKGACLKLPAPTDCVEYVPSTREVWVTTPSVQSLVVLDASPKGSLKQKETIKLAGAPEGYALDEPRGLFLTNLEDKGSTLTIDLKTHAVRDTWTPGCSADGPRGIAVDSARGLVLVACTDHVQALDAAHGGAPLGQLDTGAGLDNIDYVPSTGLLYAAAGKAARLTVAHVDEHGKFTVVSVGDTAPGARNAVASANGDAFVADPQGAHLLLLRAPNGEAHKE